MIFQVYFQQQCTCSVLEHCLQGSWKKYGVVIDPSHHTHRLEQRKHNSMMVKSRKHDGERLSTWNNDGEYWIIFCVFTIVLLNFYHHGIHLFFSYHHPTFHFLLSYYLIFTILDSMKSQNKKQRYHNGESLKKTMVKTWKLYQVFTNMVSLHGLFTIILLTFHHHTFVFLPLWFHYFDFSSL